MGLTPKREATAIRRNILALLACFSLVSYVLRMNISVAAKFMMPELGLSEIKMGQVFSAFMLGYAIFQVPGGILGDRKGPRFVLTAAATSWGLATLLTGLVPGLMIKAGLGVFASLLILRFLLGAGEAAIYPVAARAIANWTPASERAFANAVVIAGLAVGSAFTPPLISWLMVNIGWRESFYLTSVLAFLIAIAWRWYATDRPEQHTRISDQELALIAAGRKEAEVEDSRSGSWLSLLKNRQLGLISLCYFINGYILFIFVFWFYLYLVEERKFSVLSGGIFTGLPFVVATVLMPAGGYLSDYLSAVRGRRWGRRLVAISGFTLSAISLFWGAQVANPYLAIAGLSLSVGFLMATEGTFWSSAIDVAGPHSGAAGGIMNTAGNLGGVVSTALVPVLVTHFGWFFALGTGSALAIVGALIWLFIRIDQAPVISPIGSGAAQARPASSSQ